MLIPVRYQQGISLIESMIALLVISVGLLGIAALQVTSMSQNASALNHSRAVWIAYNMSDRVRANNNAFNSYDGIKTEAGNPGQDCLGSGCTAAQMVAADAADFEDMIDRLPSGQGTVTVIGNILNIQVMWDDEGTGANGTACGSDPAVDLTCYQVAVAQ
jgi:type IV pilus assembly protein PilV